MPSPHSETIPISSVAVASGSYVSTKRSSASRISSGRIVSSAIVFASLFPGSLLVPTCSGGQPAPQPGEPARHGAVDALPRDLDGHAADDLGVEHDVQVYVMAVRRRQGRRQPAALRGGERDRDVHFGHESLPSFGGQAGKLFQAHVQRTSPGLQRRLRDQPHRRLGHLATEQRVEQLTLALRREERVRHGDAQFRLGAHHPAEPEKLILQLVKRPAAARLLDDRQRRELLGRVGQVGGLGPALLHKGGNQLHRRVADLPAEQRRHQTGLALGRPGGVGQRPPQPGLGIEQPGHREQLVAELAGVDVAVEHLAEPLLGIGERRAAGASHRLASASAVLPDCSSSCSRNLSTIRRCLASVSSDSPTTRLASSTASEPISARRPTRACCRSASICAFADSTSRCRSTSPCWRSSALIWAPCSLASSRSRAASCLASASCSRYWSSSCLASVWASSDRARPPSIMSVRSVSVCWILGISILASTPNTTTNTIVPMMNSGKAGISGFCPVSDWARY